MIVLRALGSAEIETAVTTLTPSQEIVFAAALYLVLERGKRVSRARLASLLWPRVAEKARAHRLRQTILQLKKVGIIMRADRDNVQLSQYEARSDLDELTRTNSDSTAKNDSVEFMPGYSPGFSEPFRDWVDAKREETHALATRRLVNELNAARGKGDWSTCAKIANQCRSLDPFNESAVLAQAEAAAMRGAKRDAVAILDWYINEVGSGKSDLRLPAALLRTRITERIAEGTPLTAHECTFVGRDREMEALILRLTSARNSNGGACLVTGEAGIGKSRLASELMKFAELEGIQTESTICRRSDLDRPLSVFVDLVPRLRDLPGAIGCAQETLTVLRRLTEFDGRVSDANMLIDDSTVSDAKTWRALFDLFDAIADEQCLLIVLEDIQWLDRSSAKLLSAMIPWAQRKKLLFLLNERSSTGALTSQISRTDLKILPLSPLEPAFATTLVGAIIDKESGLTSSGIVDWLLSVGEGNPFFLQELGKQWLETGKQHEFPPSVGAVLDDRLSRLSRDALQALQTCAILGVNATINRVESVLEFKSHRLLSAVQELSTAGMLQAESEAEPAMTERLNVRHDLLSTAALRRLASPSLALLHRRAGIVLERETIGSGVSSSLLWACAFHWRKAGDRERAFSAARSCAEHLLEVGLPFDSGQAFERALEFCLTDEQRLLVLPRLAVALQMQGEWERSKDVLERSRQIRKKTDPGANVHDDVELALFDATWRASLDNTPVLKDVQTCVRSNDASLSHRVASGLLGLKIASNLSETAVMEDLYSGIAPLLDHPTVPAIARFAVEMIFHSVCGDFEKAAPATKQFLEAMRAEQDPLEFARALGNAGVAYRLGGRKDEAEALFLEALDYATSHGLTARGSFAAYSLVRLYLAAGDIEQARNAMERAELITQRGGDVHHVADQLYLAARLSLEAGDIEGATSRYETLLAQTTRNQSINRRTAVLALGIRIGLLKGVSADSLQPLVSELESGHLMNRGTGWQDFETHALCLGLRACGARERGQHLLTEYATVYRREKWPLPQNLCELLNAANECVESLRSDGKSGIRPLPDPALTDSI